MQISGGRVRLRAGTLYTTLDRLRTDELIAVAREEIVDNRLRRYYRLTPNGSETLAAEAARLRANAAVAQSRLAQSRLAQSRLAQSRLAPPRPNLAGGAS
jgi:DNA-binding PadR family transcriptional regulator